MKPIAALAPERIKNLPDLPTAKEGGVDVTAYTWNAIFVPNGHARRDREEAAMPRRSRR